MELTILGSGCGIPSLQHSAPGILLKVNQEPFLFDCSAGTLIRLLKAGVSYTTLQHVFFTHTHSDHTADLVPLLQALKTTPAFVRHEPLNLYGPQNFSEFLSALAVAFGNWVRFPEFPMKIVELNRDELTVNSLKIKTRPMRHSAAAIGYRIEGKNKQALVYSGDTDFNEDIIALANDAEVLILECSFCAEDKVAGHLTPREAAEIARQAHCQHLILTHFYPPYEKLFAEIKRVVPEIFSGKLSLASDFFCVQI